MEAHKRRYLAPSVLRALQVLHEVSEAPFSFGISELARRLKVGKSTVHGIVHALEATGFLQRDRRSNRYGLGESLLRLGCKAQGQLRLAEISRPYLETLVSRVKETSFIGLLKNDHLTIVGVHEGPEDMKITSPVGTTLPMLAGATGKLILANMEPQQARRVLLKRGLPTYTDRSIQNREAFLQGIERVRRQGFALDDGEYLAGVRAVAAPVYQEQRMVGAVWVVGFASRVVEERIPVAIEETVKAAKGISATLDSIATIRTG